MFRRSDLAAKDREEVSIQKKASINVVDDPYLNETGYGYKSMTVEAALERAREQAYTFGYRDDDIGDGDFESQDMIKQMADVISKVLWGYDSAKVEMANESMLRRAEEFRYQGVQSGSLAPKKIAKRGLLKEEPRIIRKR